MHSGPAVSICIASYRRPNLLSDLLRGIALLETPAGSAEVIVIDNDRRRSAELIVRRFQAGAFPFALRYAVEPIQNIALARNKAISMANGGYLAFIDDDEVPTPVWLRGLLEAIERFDCDVVFGPVEPVFELSPPRWLRDGKFYSKPFLAKLEDGIQTRYKFAATCNILLRRKLVAGPDALAFDPAFGVTGGEDSVFFQKIFERGASFGYAGRALVHEWIPSGRANLRWFFRRAFRTGQTRRLCTTFESRDAERKERSESLRQVFRKVRTAFRLYLDDRDVVGAVNTLREGFFYLGYVSTDLPWRLSEYKGKPIDKAKDKGSSALEKAGLSP